MKKLTKIQFEKMDVWMQAHTRSYDRAKWNYLFHGGTKDAIIAELLAYQNADGGLGGGFEPDVLCPLSAAIPTADAIFAAYEYDLDCTAPWFHTILAYFENTVQDIPKYWEDTPREAMDYPHAPWWSWAPALTFSPNPCAVVASAFLRYGTAAQKLLGESIARDCFTLLVSHDFCGDHDTLNLLALTEQLLAMGSPMATDEVVMAMKRRILENTCYDQSRWEEYVFQPLDFVRTPTSFGYEQMREGSIDGNLDYWLDHINPEGVWSPNFSWGIDSEVSRTVTEQWKGYITVKRAKILRDFGRIEY